MRLYKSNYAFDAHEIAILLLHLHTITFGKNKATTQTNGHRYTVQWVIIQKEIHAGLLPNLGFLAVTAFTLVKCFKMMLLGNNNDLRVWLHTIRSAILMVMLVVFMLWNSYKVDLAQGCDWEFHIWMSSLLYSGIQHSSLMV